MSSGDSAPAPVGRWLFPALLVLIAWLPVPLGSNRPWSWGLMEVAALGLLSAWLFLKGWSPAAPSGVLRRYRHITLLLGFWLGYQVLQALPLPRAVVDMLNPAAGDVYGYALPESGDRFFSLSLDPGLTLRELLKSAAYASIFLLVLSLANTRERIRQLALVLILVVFAEAVWGIVGLYPGWSSHGGRASGTYVNPNNFAGLLEMGIALTLGLLIAHSRHPARDAPRRTRLKSWIDALDVRSNRLVLYLGLVVMIAALVLSASRGGVVSILLAVIAAAALAVLLQDRGAKGAGRIVRIAGSALVVALVAFGAEVLLKRIDSGFFEAEGRMLMRQASYRMIADYPMFGSGGGSWEYLYPAYRDPETYLLLHTSYAHNDHLQLLAEQGVLGYLLIASVIVLSLREMIPKKSWGHDPLMKGILFGSVIAVLSLLIHAWVEFNFHIPANAAWFFVMLALGLVAARRLEEGNRPGAGFG